MREISGETLYAEIIRLGAVVVQTWIHHPSGVLLHAPGDVLTPEHAAQFAPAVLDRVLILEATEDRKAALASLGVVNTPLHGVSADDALAEEIVPPGGRTRYKAGTAMEASVVEAMTKDRITSVPVCRGASLAALKWARTYLDAIPQAPLKMVRPDPAGAAAVTCAWSLLTPRARVMVVTPDDATRLRIVNGILAAGHDVIEVKTYSDALTAAKSQRPDAVIVPPDGAIQVCGELRKKGETLRSIVICLAGEPAKLAGVSLKVIEAGANDILPLPATAAIFADRVRSWMRLRNKVVGLKPSIAKERRRAQRAPAAMTLRISDPGTTRPLPVTSATLLEFSDGGLRLEYGLLEPPDPGNYRPHTVHSKHPLWMYAKDNPMGRDFLVSLTGKGVPAFESHGRFTHITLVTGSEHCGVAFVKHQTGAAARVTTITRKPLT
ncbi:MAG TPA: response regulator [Planctomycetota bacterium]|nr:response regulator [Planctomycetota bacterium]